MKTYMLKCPHCGANLDVDDELSEFYCKFCGTKIRTEHIGKNEMRLKEMEHEEVMAKEKYKSERIDNITTTISLVAILVVLALIVFFMATR